MVNNMVKKIRYSLESFEATVKFISENNKTFVGREEYIRKSLLETLKRCADAEVTFIGSMGYIIVVMGEYSEGEQTITDVEFLVDPNISNNCISQTYVDLHAD